MEQWSSVSRTPLFYGVVRPWKIMTFPVEILEKILLNCDGQSLLAAKQVHEVWSNLIDYLGQKTNIWEWCCREEIPDNELVEYLEKFSVTSPGENRWLSLYKNWISWEHFDRIRVDVLPAKNPKDVTRISCLAVNDLYIVVGTESGRIMLYNTKLVPLCKHCQIAIAIKSVGFIDCDNEPKPTSYFVASNGHNLSGFHYESNRIHEFRLDHDVKNYSIYKNYLCLEKPGGRVTIARMIRTPDNVEFLEVFFKRYYPVVHVSSVQLFNGICTYVFEDTVKTINYMAVDYRKSHNKFEDKFLEFSFKSFEMRMKIMRDDIIICLYSDESDFLELFIRSKDGGFSKKLFNVWEIFNCVVTCVFVYGNCLILGVDIGNIYIYQVSSWKNLDLRQYRKIILGRHPITGIQVIERQNERKFFVSSNVNIHEVNCYTGNYEALHFNESK